MIDIHTSKSDDKSKKHIFFFVDNEKIEWDKSTVSGAELRMAASIPDDVQIFLKVPGSQDQEISPATVVDLEQHNGVAHFSTQAAGSQAG